jgi:hypothetical protein
MRLFHCCLGLIMMSPLCVLGQQAPAKPGDAAPPATPLTTGPPLSDDDKANQLSDQVGKLMVKCVNLLTAQDPLSLDYCKQQRVLKRPRSAGSDGPSCDSMPRCLKNKVSLRQRINCSRKRPSRT